MYWHGYGGTFGEFIAMPFTDRYLARAALNDVIERSNEDSTTRPKDQR